MGFTFRKSLKLGPFRLNVSKRGVSGSAKAGRASANTRGQARVNLGGGAAWTTRWRKR